MIDFLNSYFDKIFVISIHRNAHRMQDFLKNHGGLEVEIFAGVDGNELYPSISHVCNFPLSFFEENNLYFERCKNWNKGQLGCAMSNFSVQKEIIKRRLNRVLILEDDAKLVQERLPVFMKAIKELQTEWDLLYLGYTPLSRFSEHRLLHYFLKLKHLIKPVVAEGMSSNTVTKRFFSVPFSKSWVKPGVFIGTHAYALSYEGAQKLISIESPLKYGADRALMHANYNKLINGYALRKPLFVSNPNFETSIF